MDTVNALLLIATLLLANTYERFFPGYQPLPGAVVVRAEPILHA